MEYERIHKVQQQSGIISPSKLRMKLLGSHQQKKKDASNSNSSRTSPSRLEDSEILNNSLLDIQNEDVEDQGQDSTSTMQPRECISNENGDSSKVLLSLRGDNANTASVHPARPCEDELFDYDSTSSFEFHKERSHPNHVARSFSRPMPSKWNDAEKWIMNRQNVLPTSSKKIHFQNQSHRVPAISNTGRVVPEAVNNEIKLPIKRVDFSLPATQPGLEKFDFVSNGSNSMSPPDDGVNALTSYPESKDLMEADCRPLSSAKGLTESSSGIPTIRSVSMRDMGTEMTPIPSQEPSRTATPEGATTPLRSPTSSIPSTPCRAEPAPTPAEIYLNNASVCSAENGKREMSDQELKLKTRQEIVALGVQLGKMNIAAWASSKDGKEKSSTVETGDNEKLQQIEYAKRAAAWEEAEKSKHNARLRSEEIKIQAWESRQKAKFEAEMRRTEAQAEQMRMQAHAKMVRKIAMARQKSEEKRVTAEARKNCQAQKVAAQAEYIRQRGRLPSSSFICCGWS